MNAHGSAVIRAGTAGKLQSNVIVIHVLPAERVHIGIMVAEFGAQIEIFPGENGKTVASRHSAADLGCGARCHECHEIAEPKIDGARPGNARMSESAPHRFHGHGFEIVGGDRFAGGQPRFQSAVQIDAIKRQREIGRELDRCSIFFILSGKAEHLFHGVFVRKPDDIVKSSAAFRRK